MSHSPGGRESPSSTASSTTASGSGSVIGSVGSGSNGCRNSGASFDSGRATSTTFHGVRYSGGLSSESSLGSFRHSYHSSNSSLGSIPSEEIRNFDVAAMISQGVPDHEILNAWLTGLHLECYYQNFIQAGYDMHTISRMTPEDLNAIGVTKPHHRKKIKSEISQLNISEGLPDFIPDSVEEWLRMLKLEDYLSRLLDQGYHNVRQVTNITWEDLDDIGILKLGHQKKFMLAIKRIQDIASGKKVSSSYVPSAYLTPEESCPFTQQLQQQQCRPLMVPAPSMPYSPQIPLHQNMAMNIHQGGGQYQQQQSHPPSVMDPRHIIHRNQWPQQQASQMFHHQNSTSPGGISHQIQVHQPPPTSDSSGVQELNNPNNCNPHTISQQTSPAAVQPQYHPEVISIRIKNGHGNNSLDSPPEEEPIYGTSSFLPNPNPQQTSLSSGTSWQQQNHPGSRASQTFKSFEDGEITPTNNGYGNVPSNNGSNLSITKQSMSNTWTLPRLQKHKPISKVMGGGGHSLSCDSSVTYPINPGPLIPQQLGNTNPPSCTTFGKGPIVNNSSDYGIIGLKVNGGSGGPPPPPRRSSCSSLGQQQLDEDDIPLPPPPSSENPSVIVNRLQQPCSQQQSVQSSTIGSTLNKLPYVNDQVKNPYAGMSSSYYGQRSSASVVLSANTATASYHSSIVSSDNLNAMHNGNGISSLPAPCMSGFRKSRDPSPAGSDFSDHDLSQNSGIFTKGVRRNGSDASFKSNSSTESESIPFANENAGTIKQLKPGNRIPQPQTSSGSSDVPLGSNNSQNQSCGGEPCDVLSDIGSMLADLTDQLDAILEQERSSKN